MSELREYKGTNGSVVITGSEIRIDRSGLAAKIAHGRNEPWSYPIFAVSGFDVKNPTALMNGWVSIQLGNDPQIQLTGAAAASNSNTVLFSSQGRETLSALAEHLKVIVANNHSHSVDFEEFKRQGSGAARVQVVTPVENNSLGAAAGGLREDIDLAAKKMGTQFGGKREIRRLESHLHDGESVRHIAKGRYENAMGIVVLTDQRLIFLKEGFTGNKLEDFPLDKISSIQSKSGLMFGELKIYASGNSSIIDQIEKSDQRAWAGGASTLGSPPDEIRSLRASANAR